MHSHFYRYPEPFAGQSVIVFGAGASGLDISVELVQANAKVSAFVRHTLKSASLKV